jgi:hypothetical protein
LPVVVAILNGMFLTIDVLAGVKVTTPLPAVVFVSDNIVAFEIFRGRPICFSFLGNCGVLCRTLLGQHKSY